MAGFINKLDVEVLSDGVYKLRHHLSYVSDLVKLVIIVPRGFITDFASVPRVPILFTLWGNRSHHEAVIHDYLGRAGSRPDVDYDTWNNIFYEAMVVREKPWYIRYPMYWGVCIGGREFFKKRGVDGKEVGV
jgi:hypothetical protein